MAMTLEELAVVLDERDISLVVHQGQGPVSVANVDKLTTQRDWIVWLYPPDDPALLCKGEGATLLVAVLDALASWDRQNTQPS